MKKRWIPFAFVCAAISAGCADISSKTTEDPKKQTYESILNYLFGGASRDCRIVNYGKIEGHYHDKEESYFRILGIPSETADNQDHPFVGNYDFCAYANWKNDTKNNFQYYGDYNEEEKETNGKNALILCGMNGEIIECDEWIDPSPDADGEIKEKEWVSEFRRLLLDAYDGLDQDAKDRMMAPYYDPEHQEIQQFTLFGEKDGVSFSIDSGSGYEYRYTLPFGGEQKVLSYASFATFTYGDRFLEFFYPEEDDMVLVGRTGSESNNELFLEKVGLEGVEATATYEGKEKATEAAKKYHDDIRNMTVDNGPRSFETEIKADLSVTGIKDNYPDEYVGAKMRSFCHIGSDYILAETTYERGEDKEAMSFRIDHDEEGVYTMKRDATGSFTGREDVHQEQTGLSRTEAFQMIPDIRMEFLYYSTEEFLFPFLWETDKYVLEDAHVLSSKSSGSPRSIDFVYFGLREVDYYYGSIKFAGQYGKEAEVTFKDQVVMSLKTTVL